MNCNGILCHLCHVVISGLKWPKSHVFVEFEKRRYKFDQAYNIRYKIESTTVYSAFELELVSGEGGGGGARL